MLGSVVCICTVYMGFPYKFTASASTSWCPILRGPHWRFIPLAYVPSRVGGLVICLHVHVAVAAVWSILESTFICRR